MEVQKIETYKISPTDKGGVNEMTLIFEDGNGDVGCKYEFHYWHNNVSDIILRLEEMIEALKVFKRR